jgi:hypothetical protein
MNRKFSGAYSRGKYSSVGMILPDIARCCAAEDAEAPVEIEVLDSPTGEHLSVEEVRQKLMQVSARWSAAESGGGGKSHDSSGPWPRLPVKRLQRQASFVRSKSVLVPVQSACMHAMAMMLCRYIGVLSTEKMQLALKRMQDYVR